MPKLDLQAVLNEDPLVITLPSGTVIEVHDPPVATVLRREATEDSAGAMIQFLKDVLLPLGIDEKEVNSFGAVAATTLSAALNEHFLAMLRKLNPKLAKALEPLATVPTELPTG